MSRENKNNFDISDKAKFSGKENLKLKKKIKSSSVAVSDETRRKINALAYLERVSARQMADILIDEAIEGKLEDRGTEYSKSYQEELKRQS